MRSGLGIYKIKRIFGLIVVDFGVWFNLWFKFFSIDWIWMVRFVLRF